jgi:uncharacterized membrane protein YgcG
VPAWLEAIKEPIVLVTTSSEFQNDVRLVQDALEALANEPIAVVATHPAGDPIHLRIPANARVEGFVPHAPLLDRAVCAVTHAGTGATQKALSRGFPVCAVPFGRDQLEVARRVEVADAGTRLPAKRLNPERLRSKGSRSDDEGSGSRANSGGVQSGGRSSGSGGRFRVAAVVNQRGPPWGGLLVAGLSVYRGTAGAQNRGTRRI